MDDLRRGDIVLVALPGDYGKPRPALIIQSERFAEHASVTLLALTNDLQDDVFFRITVEPTAGNGLRFRSQVMVDKVLTHRRDKVVKVIGRIDGVNLAAIDQALAIWLGLDRMLPTPNPKF